MLVHAGDTDAPAASTEQVPAQSSVTVEPSGTQHESVPPPVEGVLRLNVLTPSAESDIVTAEEQLFLAGQAVTVDSGSSQQFDVVLVLDTSRSTGAASGADVDHDGRIGSGRDGRWIEATSDDPGDNVLSAQIYSVRTLLSQLDPRTTRVGIVTFSGDSNPGTRDAVRLAPLSSDFTVASKALDYLLEHRPQGYTNIADALQTATEELSGEGRSRARAGATPVVLLLTDGQPTLPFATFEENVQYTLDVGRRAAARGIRIDTFPIGDQANRDIRIGGGLAGLSGGRFTPVVDPSELLSTFEHVQLAGIKTLDVVNRTTGARAPAVLVDSDGRFCAMLPLTDGDNLVEVVASDTEGRVTSRTLNVQRSPVGGVAQLSPGLARWRERLLETRLLDLYRERMELVHELERRRKIEVQAEDGVQPE